MKCSGCDSELGDHFGTFWGWLTIWENDRFGDTNPIAFFCTPRCAYDFIRDHYQKEVDELYQIEPDLLAIVAEDIYHALEGVDDFSTGMSEEKARDVSECWARLGHVLNQLDVSPRLRDED